MAQQIIASAIEVSTGKTTFSQQVECDAAKYTLPDRYSVIFNILKLVQFTFFSVSKLTNKL